MIESYGRRIYVEPEYDDKYAWVTHWNVLCKLGE